MASHYFRLDKSVILERIPNGCFLFGGEVRGRSAMSRGEIVALANFQTTLLFGLGNGKAGDLDSMMLQNIGLDFGICGGNLCGDGVQFFGVNLQLDVGVC